MENGMDVLLIKLKDNIVSDLRVFKNQRTNGRYVNNFLGLLVFVGYLIFPTFGNLQNIHSKF